MKILSMEHQSPILKAYGLGAKMNLWQQIIQVYPELNDKDLQREGIFLQNDSDGAGDYIKKWDYTKPIPDGLSLGKPNA
jgi:hypothetical protein